MRGEGGSRGSAEIVVGFSSRRPSAFDGFGLVVGIEDQFREKHNYCNWVTPPTGSEHRPRSSAGHPAGTEARLRERALENRGIRAAKRRWTVHMNLVNNVFITLIFDCITRGRRKRGSAEASRSVRKFFVSYLSKFDLYCSKRLYQAAFLWVMRLRTAANSAQTVAEDPIEGFVSRLVGTPACRFSLGGREENRRARQPRRRCRGDGRVRFEGSPRSPPSRQPSDRPCRTSPECCCASARSICGWLSDNSAISASAQPKRRRTEPAIAAGDRGGALGLMPA